MNVLFESLFGTDHLEEYVSGVFSDCLDKMGLRDQVVAGWKLNTPRARLFGRARTLVLETMETSDERIGLGLGFLSGLGRGEILIVQGSADYAYFGELMTRLSMEIGVSGVVIDGLTRDTYFTQTVDLPIFATGYSPVDIKGRGRVGAVDVSATIGGLRVEPGDYVFGDSDAVVFIPQQHMTELTRRVLEAVEEEAEIKRKIAGGATVKEILIDHKEF